MISLSGKSNTSFFLRLKILLLVFCANSSKLDAPLFTWVSKSVLPIISLIDLPDCLAILLKVSPGLTVSIKDNNVSFALVARCIPASLFSVLICLSKHLHILFQ